MATRTPSCEHCGSPCREHTFVLSDDDDDPISILDDIKRSERAIHRLHAFKSQRCRQLNTVRSLTAILPNEILLSIFQFFCSLFESQSFPQFILGGVCTHWRNLLNTEPLFWKTINLSIRNWSVSRAASLLEVFKERNGASFELMQLEFEKLRHQTRASQQLLLSLGGVSTISKIVLDYTPVDFLQMKDTFSDVHDVSLHGLLGGPSELRPIMLGLSPPWSTLTVLTLYYIPINYCCDLLLGCSNLIRFSVDRPLGPTYGITGPNARQAQETYFPHVQQLTWYHDHSAWDNNLLSFYRFPALQRFHWLSCERERKHSIPFFREFTSFLPQSCRTFQLSGPKEDADLPMGILQPMVHPLERLICTHGDMGCLPYALERLQDQTFIPSLRFFRWEYQGRTDRTIRDMIQITRLLTSVIRGRKRIGAGGFRMEIEGIEGMLLPQEYSRRSIEELMSGDFAFEIAENGCWIISF
jgi:hypothetical protein